MTAGNPATVLNTKPNLEGADYRGSEAVRDHLQRKLFPPMACYKALCERGAPAEQALEYVRKETCKSALAKRG